MSAVTTHVLDTVAGQPAEGVAVRLERLVSGDPEVVAEARTNADGRVSDLGPETLPAGPYRLVFVTGEWFAARDRETFYPEVVVTFTLDADRPHHHVPLLLAPFAYSTYRGS
jgi:5-hydroxyisourate hydrolase